MRYYKGCLNYYAQHILRAVQPAECTPCVLLHASWIPAERVYDVGVFRVLDIYKYTQAAQSCSLLFQHIHYIHPHPPKKGAKLNSILL